ncbi:MAG: hypothetical protein IJ428_01050 [Clostridia bacterium]|nr:hypothetical protein [Clostridia bacterium]
MEIKKIYASSVAKLTSNVYTGGGDDDTLAIQQVLDMAKDENVGVHLIMDGAALVESLKLYSNTTIECMNKDCGFYQKSNMNCAVITNAIWNDYELETKNISLLGGTYHQNGQNQAHDNPNIDKQFVCPDKVTDNPDGATHPFVMGLEFYGVENLLIRDITIRDFRTFALTVGCFKNVTIENTWLDLPYGTRANQDGFHFWGPGQFLNVLHCGGKVGDDIINVGPDERDKVSSITDVLIDGIFMDDGEQGVRLLSRGTGRLDRVTIRNISGVYRSYGFYIDPWFVDDTCGNFGHILIENVDLKSVEKSYGPPFLFSAGGNIECLMLKNIRHHAAHDNRPILEIGWPFYLPHRENYKTFEEDTPYHTCRHKQRLQNIIIDGLTIVEHEDDPKDTNYISIYDKVENMIIKNVTVIKNQEENGNLLYFEDCGAVENLVMEGIHTKGLKNLISDETKVKNRF